MLPSDKRSQPGRLVGGLHPGQRADGLPERLDGAAPGPPMPQLSAEARDLTWLIGDFATKTPSVAHAMVVSADGPPVAVSDRLDRPMAD
jgi:hypothetical protein